MPFAAAVSEHPVTATAIGETVGQLLERVGRGPGLVTLFVTPHHAGALEDAARAVRTILQPGCLVGCAAEGVIGDGREIESSPGVALWAGTMPAVPVRLTTPASPDDPRALGWPAELPFEPSLLVLVADPFSFAADDAFAFVDCRHPGLPVVGGNASAARGPGGARLATQDQVVSAGAVGALIGPSTRVAAIVSQGCRPVGRPLVVTKSAGTIVYELGGRPAYERLLRVAHHELDVEPGELMNRGVFIGVVVDEYREEYRRGDFLVHRVVGADVERGSITVSAAVAVGTTTQYHVRDELTADEDLRLLLRGHAADGALLFASTSRGRRGFQTPDHDAALLDELLDRPAACGFFAAGEFAPVGRRNFSHSGSASIALLRDRE